MANGTRRAVLLLASLAMVVAGAALAAKKPAPPSDTPRYDARAEYTVRGKVTEVRVHDSMLGYKDTHLILDTIHGPLEVHVGPVAYLASRGFDVKAGDEVLVTGCKALYEDKSVLVARKVALGNHEVTLRSMGGQPVWPKNLKG